MKKTKVFKSGNSQAVRLPQGFTFKESEVYIYKHGDEVILKAIPQNLKAAFELLTDLPEDFLENREDTPPQQREEVE